MDLLKRQGFFNSIILYAGTALGFFNLVVLFQRVLTTEEIGFFALMNGVALLYAQIASIGINNIILKYLPYYRTEDKKHGGFVTFVMIWCGLSFILFTVLFLLFKDQIILYYQHSKGSALLVRYFYYLVPLAFLSLVYAVIESLAITIFKNILSAFLREVLLRIFTSVSIVLIAYSVATYHDFLNIYLAANAIILVVLWYNLLKNKQFKLSKISPKLIDQKSELLRYGFFTLLSGTSFVLIQNLDNLMLSALTKDLGLVGIYSTFFAIALVISLPAKALSRTSVQIIAQAWAADDMPKINKIYYKTSIVQMLFGCLLFIGLVVNKQFILVLLNKPQYVPYFNVFIVIGLGFLADMTGGVNGYIINLSKYYKFTTYFILSAVIICAGTNWLLIPTMKMMGAAVAYFASMLAVNFFYWFYVKLKFGMQPFGMAHLLVLIISAVTLLVGVYLPVISNFWVDMLIRSSIVLIIYGTLTYLFKISEDVNAVFDKVLKKRSS